MSVLFTVPGNMGVVPTSPLSRYHSLSNLSHISLDENWVAERALYREQ